MAAKITADKLTGSAAAAVEFAANVAKLGAFSVSGNFTLTNDAALAINDDVTATGGTVNIIAGGGITTDTGKKITALTVSGSATDAVDIKTNVTNLGAFTVTGNKNFTLTNDGALMVTGNVAASGGVVRLVATVGGISGTGKITALTVGGSAAGAVDIKTNVTNLGAFAVTGGGNFTLVNDAALTVNGAVALTNAAGTAGNASLTTSAGGIVISTAAGAVGTIAGNGLAIASAGAVSLTGLTLTGAITGTVAGAVTLTNVTANFSNLQQTENGAFSLISNVSLTSLVAPNRATGKTGDVYYEVTGAATMTLSAAANFGANNATLKSAAALEINQDITTTGTLELISTGGGITTSAGKKITALTVGGSATNAVDITTNVTNLGTFTVTGNKNLTVTNDGALVVTGNVSAVGGVVKLTSTAAGN